MAVSALVCGHLRIHFCMMAEAWICRGQSRVPGAGGCRQRSVRPGLTCALRALDSFCDCDNLIAALLGLGEAYHPPFVNRVVHHAREARRRR